MLGIVRLSVSLLRRHLSLYAGCMVTIGASAAIASAEATLVEGFSHPENVTVPGLSAGEVAAQMVQVRGLFIVFAVIVILASSFLVWSAVKQVVMFRERELALMRLAGASRSLLARTVFIECFTLAFAVALPASFVGELLATPLFAGLQAIKFFGPGVEAHFGLTLTVALIITPILALTSGIAGAMAALSATRGDLLSAVNPVGRRMSRVQIAVRLLIGLLGVVGIATLDPVALGANLILVLPVLAVVPLVAVAPLLVPAGAWLIGRLVGLVAPGAGRLAAARASKDRIRYARLATPVIVAVGILGGFLVGNAPDEQLAAADFQARVNASVVATTTGTTNADETATALREAGGTDVARLTTRKHNVSGEPRNLYFTDPVALAPLLKQKVVSGDLARVGGLNVASSDPADELGDTMTTRDASGKTVTLTVVAVIADDVWAGLWFDWSEVSKILEDPATLSTEVFASPITQQQAASEIDAAGIDATVTDKAGYVQHLKDERAANTNKSNIGLFGTIYIMCIISLFQSAVSGNVARRREFRVLGSLGVGRRGIAQTVATETVIVQVVAGVLVAAVLVAFGLRFAAVNGTSAFAAISSVAPQTAIAYLSIAVTALVAQLVGTSIALSKGAGLDTTQTTERL